MLQNFLIVIIVVAILNYIIGSSFGPTKDEEIAQGFVGINCKMFLLSTTNIFVFLNWIGKFVAITVLLLLLLNRLLIKNK